MTNLELSKFVEDLAKHQSTKPIRYFLDKYKIDYETYNQLKYASVPVSNYMNSCKRYRHKIAGFSQRVTDPIRICKQIAIDTKNQRLEIELSRISEALYELNQPLGGKENAED